MWEELDDIDALFAVKLHVALDFHPRSSSLEELIETDIGRIEADAFIWDVYLDYVPGTDSYEEMKQKIAEKTLEGRRKTAKYVRRPASQRSVKRSPTIAVKTRKVLKPRKGLRLTSSQFVDLIMEIERRRLRGEKIDAIKFLRERRMRVKKPLFGSRS